MHDVIGFGAINLDLIYQVDSLSDISGEEIGLLPGKELSAGPEVFSTILQKVEERGILKLKSGGGSAANTIVALSLMGFKTGFVGKVGNDPEGQKLLSDMVGVDLWGVVSGGKSGRCLCILDKKQDRSILLEPNTNDTLAVEEIDFRYATNARYIHLTSFVGEKPFLAQKALTERVYPPAQISFDPGEVYVRRGLEYLEPLLRKSALVLATDREIEMLTGLDFVDGSRRLLELGPSIVVCKRGERGVHVSSQTGSFDLPAESTDVIDNTGVGDVFNAGFLAGLLMNRPLLECASFGSQLAARSLTGYGRSRYPERKDLEFFSKSR